MNREDLKNYKYNQIWIKDQTEYIEAQKETINRLTAILSDMPKGSKYIYDTEAEKIIKLQDCFSELMNMVLQEEEKQKEIVKEVNKMEYPFKNILFKVYIQSKTLVKTASEMGYDYKYMCKMHGIALEKFDNTTKKVETRL